ncbi:ATPase [Allosphingosinicella flava]|uniref:histidine kinase n=1 Tax=Allosphingosinicella flava TaxID=2771430 RepID=A0A7T2GJW6_9SPHN|nr:ATP-binding protein [Sphingosinicella flava]QPQ55228.1 ATPase [Sphingosinicella flava]
MGRYQPKTVLLGLAVAMAAILLTVALGASLLLSVLALFAGAASALFITRRASGEAEVADEAPIIAAPPIEAAPILDAVEDPLLLVRERRVVLANAAARAVLGEHIADADVRLAIRHPAAAERLANVAEAEASGIELLGIGGSERRWEMSVARLPDGARLVRLTDRSRVHAAEQMRTDFIANASHELRTPLATVLGFLETLLDDPDAPPEARNRFLKIMFDEATRMRQIVNDLISLSRIEAERYTLPTEPVDLLPVLSEVDNTLENVVKDRKSEIRIENLAGETLIPGDPAQLHQLFSNLVANALKYGREGRPVTVRIENSGPEMLKVDVIDEGEGIAPEHLPRLTERFYRVDAGRSRSVGGTGLGLAIVKHIAGRHLGRLDIRSTQGIGTTVSVYLPRWTGALS